MDVVLELRQFDADLASVRLEVRQRRRRRLLHHIAQLTGQLQLTLAGCQRGLDEDDLAACRRPHQAGGDSGTVDAFGDIVEMAALAQRRPHAPDVDRLADLLADRDVGHGTAHHRRDLALEIADACLARVLAHDEADRVVGHRHLVGSQSVGGELLGDEEAPRDVHLLGLGVAREVQHLHAVSQRGRDGVERVGGGDEHDLREIERHVEIVVAKVLVLLGVEDFEQRG